MSQPAHDKRPIRRIDEPPDHFQEIYLTRAADYHRMISAEDVDENIFPAIREITSIAGLRILDIGSGTGRIPLLLGDSPRQVLALDFSLPMLVENCKQRNTSSGGWHLAQADMARLPVHTNSFDVVLAGWAIGHQRFWYRSSWIDRIGQILSEMERVTENGGTLIIFETLGTGASAPSPPVDELAEYYEWLVEAHRFVKTEIQTDYLFASVEQAVEATAFFFGKELSNQIIYNEWCRLPEWTGVWYKRIHST